MSKELMRRSVGTLSTRDEVGGNLMKLGLGGLALGGVAWVLPFISLPMLLVAVVVAGFVVAKGDSYV